MTDYPSPQHKDAIEQLLTLVKRIYPKPNCSLCGCSSSEQFALCEACLDRLREVVKHDRQT